MFGGKYNYSEDKMLGKIIKNQKGGTIIGILIAGAFAIYRPSFIIILILLFSLPRLFTLFRKRTDEENRFFEISHSKRLIAAFIYFGLIVILGTGMLFAYIPITSS